MVLAAAPEWLNDNLVLLSTAVLLAVALLVVRTVQRLALRLALLALLAGTLLFVTIEHDALTECGRTCSCELVTIDVDLPACEPELLSR